jgi:hypothetical protein
MATADDFAAERRQVKLGWITTRRCALTEQLITSVFVDASLICQTNG